MNNEIVGNSYKYIIDESYGINQDGYIAHGTESIVYKGLKTKLEGGLQFSCVLKFKPKAVEVDGKVINRLETFKTEEWKIFEELRECRSIVRIDDVIDSLGSFSLFCKYVERVEEDEKGEKKVVKGIVIKDDEYFCVVEEFIDGWNLDEFCNEEYWKLRRRELIGNGLVDIIRYNDFSDAEKKSVLSSYNYDNILKYQEQILLFMINLCEIMEFVTEQKNILHLDIKPENIMVTKHGKELVLIDFGRSKTVTKANRFAQSDLSAVDYNDKEQKDKMYYQYGTLGYAAPECYNEAANGSAFPFSMNVQHGKMSIESDIFSFGATFWECLNIFELVTKNKQFSQSVHDFYRDYFFNDNAYCNRDLSLTSTVYHKKLETVIKKCTRVRNKNFSDNTNDKYYHSYKELRKDIEMAKDSVPTIIKEENVKVKKSFNLCGAMLSVFSIFLLIFGIYHLAAFNMAQRKWDNITSNYNSTQFHRLEENANDLIDTAPSNQVSDIYDKIAIFTYKDDDISEYEATMLVELLQKVNNKSQLPKHIDEIMQYADAKKFKEISREIVKFEEVSNSIGYELAQAIFNVEIGKTGILEAYQTLQTYQGNKEFSNAIIKLKNVLDNDKNIKMISDSEGVTRQEIQDFFKSIAL